MLHRAALSVLVAISASVAPLANAAQPQSASTGGITRLEITRVESPTFDGRVFGDVGQYVKIIGRAYGQVDPKDPRNAVITDLNLAPRNSSGMVDYVTDIFILKPLDSSKSNHRLFFEINNRGGNLSFGQLNDATTGGNDPTVAGDAGNGYLMEQGYTIVLSGWDVTATPGAGRLTITAPVAMSGPGCPDRKSAHLKPSTTPTMGFNP